MEETLPLDHTGSETDDESDATVMAAVGCLKVVAKDSEEERCYPVFKGVNTVGRSTTCQICIPIKAISKHHATILVEKDSHFLQDNNSKNHTRRNKVLLRSKTYYELSDKCDLLFGDCACVYYTSKEQWELFAAKKEDSSQTLCESVAMTTANHLLEETLPVTPAADTGGSRDMTDVLFSPDGLTNDHAVPMATEQTQLLVTAEADGAVTTNGSDSVSSSPLLTEQDREATQLIPLAEVAAADCDNENDAEPTIAYHIAPTTGSSNHSPTAYDDIDATIPYDMTQGVILHKNSASNSPTMEDVENTIPYEMTQGVIGGNFTESSPTRRSPVNDVEPTIPYEMSDASSPDNDPTVGVADPTVAVSDHTVATADSTAGVADSTVGMADPTVGVADPTVAVADPASDIDDNTQCLSNDEPTVLFADPTVAVDDADETQSIDDNLTAEIDQTVGVAEMDTGIAAETATSDQNVINHVESPAASPSHSHGGASPVHTATPILKDVTSPKSSTPKKVHFEASKPPTLPLPATPPSSSGSGVKLSLDDEESPDIELPPARTLLEPHPPLSNDDTAAATAKGGARRRGKQKSEASTRNRTRRSLADDEAVINDVVTREETAEGKRGRAKATRSKSAESAKAETSVKATTRSEGIKDKPSTRGKGKKSSTENARSGTGTAKGRATTKKGGAQTNKRGGKKKAAEPPTDSDDTPIATPTTESPSFLTDADNLFSGGARIKRKYTDFLLTPKRDRLSKHEETASVEPTLSEPESPLASHDPSTSSIASHDSTTVSHNPPMPKVLFTGIVDEEGQKVVKDLGGELVESVYECTHLVTDDKLRRTVKLLCCIGRGCPITSPQWLKKCKQQKKFVPAEPFVIKDRLFEKQRKCSLSASLAKAKAGAPLLQDKQFYITAGVLPAPSDMNDIIKCAGGEVLDCMPLVGGDNISIVTCEADLSTCKAASEGGVSLYSNEYLLSGILQQQLDPESHRLVVKEEERRPNNKRRISSSSGSSSEVVSSSTKRRRK